MVPEQAHDLKEYITMKLSALGRQRVRVVPARGGHYVVLVTWPDGAEERVTTPAEAAALVARGAAA